MIHIKYVTTLVVLSFSMVGCGAAVSSSPVSTAANTSATTSSSTSSTSTSLSLSVTSSNVTENGTVTFTASGGTPPYSYFSENTTLGTVVSSTGVFTAGSTAGNEIIEVIDSAGALATQAVTIISPLVITPSATSIAAGGTVSFTVSGGTAPYLYLIPVGDGSLSVSGSSSSTSTVYTSSALDSTDVELEVVDSSATPQTVYSTVAVTSSGSSSSTSVFSSYTSVLTDDTIGITYNNNSSLTNPELIFFGTGSKPNETTMFAHTAVSSCGHDSSGNTNSPCTQTVSLTNYVNGSSYSYAYEGTINFSGRSGSGYVSFCIPPSTGTQAVAYLTPGSLVGSASNEQFLEMSYNDSKDGRALLNGVPVLSFYTQTDTNSGTGYTTMSVTSAGFTSKTNCSSYGSTTIQVY